MGEMKHKLTALAAAMLLWVLCASLTVVACEAKPTGPAHAPTGVVIDRATLRYGTHRYWLLLEDARHIRNTVWVGIEGWRSCTKRTYYPTCLGKD